MTTMEERLILVYLFCESSWRWRCLAMAPYQGWIALRNGQRPMGRKIDAREIVVFCCTAICMANMTCNGWSRDLQAGVFHMLGGAP